jgi:predicted permease
LLLRLFPRRFREGYGNDMAASFEAKLVDVRQEEGRRGVARLWLRTVINLMAAAAAERWRSSFAVRPRASGVSAWRTTRGAPWLTTLGAELRLAARRLLVRPGASVASILTLACAIGAGAATWTLLSATLLHPLAIDDPARVVVVGLGDSARRSTPPQMAHVYPTYDAIRVSGVFGGLAAGGSRTLPVVASGVSDFRTVFFASHDYFDTLGVRFARGRGFREDEDRPGAPLVAVISDRFWRGVLSTDPDVVGRTITVADRHAVVIGVAPPRFVGLNLASAPDLYLPLRTIRDVITTGPTNFFDDPAVRESPVAWVTIAARLRTGMSTADAVAALDLFARRVPSMRGSEAELQSAAIAAIPAAARPAMSGFAHLLAATVGLLLLIGCLTVGSLLLMRTEARRDELGTCLALGASRRRLAFGIGLEGALLSFTGAALGVPIGALLVRGACAFRLPGGIDVASLGPTIDLRALGAVAGCAVAASLGIALVAAMEGSSASIADAVRSRAGATPRRVRRRARAMLVVGQVAVALVFVAGAMLFARSLVHALRLNPGFDTAHLVTGTIGLGAYGYAPARGDGFFNELSRRLARDPEVRSVALSAFLGGMSPSGRLAIDGVPRSFPAFVAFTGIDGRYFPTMGLRVIEGRDFTPDDRRGSPRVAIVSRSFGRWLADGGSAIGHRITEPYSSEGQPAAVLEVVGVVPDVITDVNVLEPLVEYLPLAQESSSFPTRDITFRAAGDPAAAIRATFRAVAEIDPSVVPRALETMDAHIARQMSQQQLGMAVLGAFGVVALILTLVGAYVLTASMAAARMREMGIRAALGASGRQIGGIVLAETATLVGTGILIGLGLAWAGAGTIRPFLFRVTPLEPGPLAAVALAIFLVALAVGYAPARRASRVDLARLLREE